MCQYTFIRFALSLWPNLRAKQVIKSNQKSISCFQVLLDFLVVNGGASEAMELEAVAVEEEMENEERVRDSNACLAFLLDISTFHRKDFTLLKSS